MARPVTLFAGQWADLTFETICKKGKGFGFDGLELACWGDHFDVGKACKSKDYCDSRHEILARHRQFHLAVGVQLSARFACDD